MKHLKKIAVVVVLSALAATAFAVVKVNSSAGFSVINLSGEQSVKTTSAGNCDISFPTKVTPDNADPITLTKHSHFPCYAVYRGAESVYYNYRCAIKLSKNAHGVIALSVLTPGKGCFSPDHASVLMNPTSSS